MIESYQIYSSTDNILSRFSISLNEYTIPINRACTIKTGAKGYVITSENDRELCRMKFGLTPYWAKSPMDIIHARAEGDRNLDNDPYYNGPNSIFLKPAFKKAIQHYRCLIIADTYVEKMNDMSFLITISEGNFPGVFAGIYDYWKDPETGILYPGYSIITIPANEMLQSIGIKRMPAILSFYNCANWIKPQKPLNYYLPLLDTTRFQPVNVIPFNIEGKPQVQHQQEKITDYADGPFPKRYYSKKHMRASVIKETIGERIEREKNLKF